MMYFVVILPVSNFMSLRVILILEAIPDDDVLQEDVAYLIIDSDENEKIIIDHDLKLH